MDGYPSYAEVLLLTGCYMTALQLDKTISKSADATGDVMNMMYDTTFTNRVHQACEVSIGKAYHFDVGELQICWPHVTVERATQIVQMRSGIVVV